MPPRSLDVHPHAGLALEWDTDPARGALPWAGAASPHHRPCAEAEQESTTIHGCGRLHEAWRPGGYAARALVNRKDTGVPLELRRVPNRGFPRRVPRYDAPAVSHFNYFFLGQ